MARHRDANRQVHPLHNNDTAVLTAAKAEWDKVVALGHTNGFRNARVRSCLTGTIGFMMDCDTTGIETVTSLVKFKKVGGGSMQISQL